MICQSIALDMLNCISIYSPNNLNIILYHLFFSLAPTIDYELQHLEFKAQL
jgi:hypothetical protein